MIGISIAIEIKMMITSNHAQRNDLHILQVVKPILDKSLFIKTQSPALARSFDPIPVSRYGPMKSC